MEHPAKDPLTLRKTLRAYVSNAQYNEEKLQKFHQQELQFIAADGLQELASIINIEYKNNFQLDFVSLLLLDEHYEIRHILDSLQLAEDSLNILFTDIPIETSLFPRGYQPILGSTNNEIIEQFLPASSNALKSAAILPLRRGDKLIGTLNIASKDANRFISGSATDFIERLMTILAVCIENAINHEKVKLLGLIDPLTGIHNRRYFEQRLNEEITNATRQGNELGLMIIDLDHFKNINDTCGHPVGDLVLREISTLIRMQLRLSDVLARYGGEEFVVIIGNSHLKMVHEVAERIRQSINQHGEFAKMKLPGKVSVSIGLCLLPAVTQQVSTKQLACQLIKRADEALYKSKEMGRNRTTIARFPG